jgi:hypothetical protein
MCSYGLVYIGMIIYLDTSIYSISRKWLGLNLIKWGVKLGQANLRGWALDMYRCYI